MSKTSSGNKNGSPSSEVAKVYGVKEYSRSNPISHGVHFAPNYSKVGAFRLSSFKHH